MTLTPHAPHSHVRLGQVDHLSLKKNRRYSHTRVEGAQDSGQWTSVELNP